MSDAKLIIPRIWFIEKKKKKFFQSFYFVRDKLTSGRIFLYLKNRCKIKKNPFLDDITRMDSFESNYLNEKLRTNCWKNKGEKPTAVTGKIIREREAEKRTNRKSREKIASQACLKRTSKKKKNLQRKNFKN